MEDRDQLEGKSFFNAKSMRRVDEMTYLAHTKVG